MQGIERSNLLMLIYDVKKEDLQKVSSNSKNFELLFNHFDKLDRKADMNLKTETIFGVDSKFLDSVTSAIHTGEDRGEILGDLKFIIDDAKLEEYIAANPDLKGKEKEDVYAELVLALWESVLKISYFENDGQIINFICRALKNRYYELYRNSKKRCEYEINSTDDIYFVKESSKDLTDDLIISEDLYKIINTYKGRCML